MYKMCVMSVYLYTHTHLYIHTHTPLSLSPSPCLDMQIEASCEKQTVSTMPGVQQIQSLLREVCATSAFQNLQGLCKIGRGGLQCLSFRHSQTWPLIEVLKNLCT